jgi:sulfoxide reductase heme-binding subunit YedZ
MTATAAGSPALWFVSRGSGLALLVVLSVVMALGAATRTSSAPRRMPRLVWAELHRTLALFSVAFLALHVATAILDPYVSIGWAAALLPFTSGYRALAVGLGTLAVDLGGAVLLTSLVRGRLRWRAWRAVHWMAYLTWAAAFAHSLTAGSDLRTWWVAVITLGCAATVATAVLARLIHAGIRRQENRLPAGRRPGRASRLFPRERTSL